MEDGGRREVGDDGLFSGLMWEQQRARIVAMREFTRNKSKEQSWAGANVHAVAEGVGALCRDSLKRMDILFGVKTRSEGRERSGSRHGGGRFSVCETGPVEAAVPRRVVHGIQRVLLEEGWWRRYGSNEEREGGNPE